MFLRLRNAVAGVVRDLRFPQAKLRDEIRSSEMQGERLPDWWERQHARGAKYWLSGSRPRRVWSLLGVAGRIAPGATVLDVGVGFGDAAKAMRRIGCVVDALDVSTAALQRVEAITERRFTPAQLAAIPSARYDVAVSFLVAQHMSHAGLEEQIRHVVRALKPAGVFAIQVAFPLDGATTDDSSDKQKLGTVLRTAATVEQLVGGSGRILRAAEIGRYPEFGSGWMAYHIAPRA